MGEQPGVRTAAQALIDGIERIRPEFLVYVPDSTAKQVFKHFQDAPHVRALIMTKEEEGVGVLCGLVLTDRVAVMLMQDTGFGNAITALGTFAQPYHVPCLLVAARTGGVGEINSAVGGYSDRLPAVLQAAGIPTETLDRRTPLADWPDRVAGLHEYARISHQPVALLVDLKHR